MKAQFYSSIFKLVLLFLFQSFSMSLVIGQNIEWTSQFGTGAWAVSADASGVYVGIMRKYDPTGIVVWTRQVGTGNGEFTRANTVDASGVYVCGTVSAVPN